MSILMAVFLTSLMVAVGVSLLARFIIRNDPAAYYWSLNSGEFDRFAAMGFVFWFAVATAVVSALWLIWRAAL